MGPDGSQASRRSLYAQGDDRDIPRETTEEGPRRVPPLVACGDRAVGTEKSPYQQHEEPYNPKPTRRAKLAARTASGRARLAVVGDLAGQLVVRGIRRDS